MYRLITSSLPCLPTVLTKYPSVQNSPPHNCFFTSGQAANISRAVMLFISCTIFFGLYVGTDCTRKCTWSLSVPISRNVISNRLLISRQTSFSFLSTGGVNTARRYFAGQTMLYGNAQVLGPC